MPFPTLTQIDSSRLTLRTVEAGDLPDLLEVNGDSEVTRFLPYATWNSLQDGEAWLARMAVLGTSGTGQQLVVVRRIDSKVVGTMLLFKHDEGSNRMELGYALGRAHWRQGLMREAILAACSYAFGTMGIRRIEAEVNPANLASCALLLGVGFSLEGRLRKRWVAKGVAYDTNFYGCLAEGWIAEHHAA
jgi:RimJ/RimL family protein N-acetyltransferase